MKHLVQKKIEIETDITRFQTGIVSLSHVKYCDLLAIAASWLPL